MRDRRPTLLPYIPSPFIVVIIGAAVAPLVVALRPRFWWASTLCSLAGVAFPGAVYLFESTIALYPIQPVALIVLSELLMLGAALIMAGMWLLWPANPAVPTHLSLAGLSNGVT